MAPPAAASAPRTAEERAAAGKAARRRLPLDAHAELDLTDRPDPVDLLAGQAATRVPELVPIRHGRMAASPFAFYRGSALVMATDLARSAHSGLLVQLCGDAHLSNFGVFATPERQLAFDLNDFDETHPGPFEWDVKRLAGSLAVVARGAGLSRKKRRKVLVATAAAYREAVAELAGLGNLAVWYAHVDMTELLAEIGKELGAKGEQRTRAALDKARERDSLHALRKLATVEGGRARIRSQPPLLVPLRDLLAAREETVAAERLGGLLDSYRRTLPADRRHLLGQYELVDIAHKVVGVGSVGTRAWVLLLQGLTGQDPLFLQAKEAQQSVLAGLVRAPRVRQQGQRVVAGQQLMQAVSDVFLGWDRVTGPDGVERDFYVRQLRDGKGSLPPEEMRPRGLAFYARVCAQTLARAHARSGDRVAIAAYLGRSARFDEAVADHAEAVADLTERDHAALLAAIDAGRLTAAHGL